MRAAGLVAAAVLVGCAARPRSAAPRTVARPPAARPATPEPRIATEVVRWSSGREVVLAVTDTVDPSRWPSVGDGLWYVRPGNRDASASELTQFVALAAERGATGISLAGFRNADDATIRALGDRSRALTFVDVSNTAISEAGVTTVLALPGLQHAWLASTPVFDAALSGLRADAPLTSLRVDGTAITDAGLRTVASLSNLQVLSAGRTSISDAGVGDLLRARPLRYLAVPHTGTSGAALRSLGPACALEGIDLSGTRIDNAAADALLRNCRQLAEVDLAENGISEVSAVEGLPLRRLNLAGTKVRTSVLASIARASALAWLDVGRTDVVARNLAQLADLRALEHLGLAHTAVRAGAIDVILRNPELRELDLTAAKIVDDDARRLGSLRHLTSLDLSSTGITDAIAPLFATWSQLERLDLARTAVGDRVVSRLAATVRVLDLTATRVTGASTGKLAELTRLEALYLSASAMDGPFTALGALVRLRVLHVADLELGDEAAAMLSSLTRLEELELSGTRITNRTLNALASLPRLRSLGLDRLPLADGDMPALRSLGMLDTLTLRGVHVTDAGIGALSQATRLAHLSIEDTNATDAACGLLASSSTLVAIDISGTDVTAACISALSLAPRLRELYAERITLAPAALRFAPGSPIELLSTEGAGGTIARLTYSCRSARSRRFACPAHGSPRPAGAASRIARSRSWAGSREGGQRAPAGLGPSGFLNAMVASFGRRCPSSRTAPAARSERLSAINVPSPVTARGGRFGYANRWRSALIGGWVSVGRPSSPAVCSSPLRPPTRWLPATARPRARRPGSPLTT